MTEFGVLVEWNTVGCIKIRILRTIRLANQGVTKIISMLAIMIIIIISTGIIITSANKTCSVARFLR